MNYKKIRLVAIALLLTLTAFAKKQPTNVLIILVDDMGWGDVGFNGCTDIPTPHLDKLAADGVVFSQGYATHSYCGPSRAGLLSGRSQQRFGCENNLNRESVGQLGIPQKEVLISETLKDNGYQTCAIGKWHLGDSLAFWPTNNGFDDWFGFSGGSRDFWGHRDDKADTPSQQIRLDGTPAPINTLSYLTDDFTAAALNYIEEYTAKKDPFFMYLAYNAPHAPIQATKEYLALVDHIEDGTRAAYAAMVAGVDAGVGEIIAKLKAKGEYENTLIFFYSDNGGHGMGSSQAPFRGKKGMLFEGGIRVPFSMTWPNGLEGGTVYDKPVVAYDIYATVLGATEAKMKQKDRLEGVNLLPFVKGETPTERPHNNIFWRYSDGQGYVARQGDYKLIKETVREDKMFLFDMANDPLEHHNLYYEMPEKVAELKALYAEWDKDNVENLWQDAHIRNVLKTKKMREDIIRKTSGGEKKISLNDANNK